MKLRQALLLACGVTTLIMLASCENKTIGPVAIEGTDMCSFCRMSISEKRYAAELIDNEGEVFKFDDIGCLANFVKQKGTTGATFVMDFDRREWLRAENAVYVRSAELETPMNGGIVAFKDEARANAAVAKYHGSMLRFAEVTK